MADEINFDVFHFSGSEVNRVQFAIPWKALSFHNFVGRIIKECDPENKKLNLHFLPVLYINLEGDHVQLDWEEDEYLKFLDFIRRSKECGHEYVHLIIPNIGNEKTKSDRTGELRSIRLGENELNLYELNDLFSMKLDGEKSSRIEEALRSAAAHIVLSQPQPAPTTAHPEQLLKRQAVSSSYGMLDVKCISRDDLPQLLANGSQILVPTKDGNYLSMNFSKNYTYAPYKFFSWQNVEEETCPPTYRCREMKIPVCVENNGIRVSDESKNLIASLVKCSLNVEQKIRESEQSRHQDTCIQSQRLAQPEMCEQHTSQYRFQQPASFRHGPKFQNLIDNKTSLLKESYPNHEEQIPAWFYRHMEKFKADLVADMKEDLMENVKQILLVHYGLPNTGQDIMLKNQKNMVDSSYENEAPQHDAKETKDDWEVVKGFWNEEFNRNGCNNQSKETDSDAVRGSEREYKSEFGTSNCVPDEFYDSDSSISITLDDCVNDDDDVSVDSQSSFIKIPRCFVTQFKDASESTLASVSVPVRVKKHRAAKKMKSTMSTTEFRMNGETAPSFVPASSSQEGIHSKPIKDGKLTVPTAKVQVPDSNSSSSSSSRMENDVETSPNATVQSASKDCNPASSLPRKQKAKPKPKANFSSGDSVPRITEVSESGDTKNVEFGQQTQPLNILHDKVFEMTNNVFKNVFNSVKIPHSNEVKESVQKVFEESMSAASRLIPNPLHTGTVPSFPTENSNASTSSSPPAPAPASAPAKEDASSSMPLSDVNENRSRPGTNANDYVSRFCDLPDKVKADLTLLNEMGFVNNGHNLFLLTKYPDDMEKVVESLVNFTVF